MENEKKYLKPEADIVVFDSEDIILTSDFDIGSEEIQQQSKVTILTKTRWYCYARYHLCFIYTTFIFVLMETNKNE